MITLAPLPLRVPLTLSQAWRDEPEPNFRPATVFLSYRPGTLFIDAELTDEEVFTQATGFNQRLWTLGDVFEIFLRPPGGDGYLEFHVAPGNYQMQLRFPNAETIRALRAGTDQLERYFVSEPLFSSETERTPAGWRVRAQIPHADFRPGRLWGGSFCRYDASSNQPDPILSSTSPHTADRLDFHDQSVWATLAF